MLVLNPIIFYYYFNNFFIFLILILILIVFILNFIFLFLNKIDILSFFITCEFCIIINSALFALLAIFYFEVFFLIISLVILVIAACDAVIGLTLVLLNYRITKTIKLEDLNLLK